MVRLPDRFTVPDLGTDTLRLRAAQERDVPRIVEACTDPLTARFTLVPSGYTAADARGWLAAGAASRQEGAGTHLAVVERDTDRIVGAVGADVDRADLYAEVGYWVHPDSRRRGVASTGLRLLLGWLFDELELPRVQLRASATNDGSIAVARSLGFTHEGTWREGAVDGPTGDPTAPRCDVVLFGLLRREWTAAGA
ncbi:MAG: GNAT family N-acetyltransferase [Actinomycetes bacterium]